MPAQSPEATRALLAAAFNAGDLDAFVAVNEDDAALVVPPGGSCSTSRSAATEIAVGRWQHCVIRHAARCSWNGSAARASLEAHMYEEVTPMTDLDLTIRMASPADAPALERLAQLDSARVPTGRVLLAEAGGAPMAAVSLDTGALVANPFKRTAHVVRVLRLRRYQVTRQGGRRPLRSLLRRPRAHAHGLT
jgi:hypothetical protein